MNNKKKIYNLCYSSWSKNVKTYPFEELFNPRLFSVHMLRGNLFNVTHSLDQFLNRFGIARGQLWPFISPAFSMLVNFGPRLTAKVGLDLHVTWDQLIKFGMPLAFVLFVGAERFIVGDFNKSEMKITVEYTQNSCFAFVWKTLEIKVPIIIRIKCWIDKWVF